MYPWVIRSLSDLCMAHASVWTQLAGLGFLYSMSGVGPPISGPQQANPGMSEWWTGLDSKKATRNARVLIKTEAGSYTRWLLLILLATVSNKANLRFRDWGHFHILVRGLVKSHHYRIDAKRRIIRTTFANNLFSQHNGISVGAKVLTFISESSGEGLP